MWKTGHSLIKSKLKEEHAALAGEMSGHSFSRIDITVSTMRFTRHFGCSKSSAAKAKASLQILADLPKSFFTPEIRIDCADDKKFSVVKKAAEYFSSHYDVIAIDGARVKFANGWGLVRASNTQPALVTRYEASDQKSLDEIRAIFEAKLKELGAM